MIIFLATPLDSPPLTAIQLLWLNLITDGASRLPSPSKKATRISCCKTTRQRRTHRQPFDARGFDRANHRATVAVLAAFGMGLLWHLEVGRNLLGIPSRIFSITIGVA